MEWKAIFDVGLEYGDNNYDGKIDNKKSENEFPEFNEKN